MIGTVWARTAPRGQEAEWDRSNSSFSQICSICRIYFVHVVIFPFCRWQQASPSLTIIQATNTQLLKCKPYIATDMFENMIEKNIGSFYRTEAAQPVGKGLADSLPADISRGHDMQTLKTLVWRLDKVQSHPSRESRVLVVLGRVSATHPGGINHTHQA